MIETFHPAPLDKHAAHPDVATNADREMHKKLRAGLVESFPDSASINPEIGYILNSISAAYDVGFISDQEEAGMFLAGELE